MEFLAQINLVLCKDMIFFYNKGNHNKEYYNKGNNAVWW